MERASGRITTVSVAKCESVPAEPGTRADALQLTLRFSFRARLTASVGHQGCREKNRRGTFHGQEALPHLGWWLSQTGSNPPAGRRSARACRRPAAERASPHGQGRYSAGCATWPSRWDRWGRPPLSHGKGWPVRSGRRSPEPVWRRRAVGARGVLLAPHLAQRRRVLLWSGGVFRGLAMGGGSPWGRVQGPGSLPRQRPP